MPRQARNRRVRSVGMAPVPTPLFFTYELPVAINTHVSLDLYFIAESRPLTLEGDLQETDLPCNVKVFPEGSTVPTGIVTAQVVTSLGVSSLRYNFTPALPGGVFTVVHVGFDPSIRGKNGEYVTPFCLVLDL